MKITDFRLSSVWVEGNAQLIDVNDMGRFGCLIRAASYGDVFKKLLGSDSDPLVTVPWPHVDDQKYPSSNNYWNEYLIRSLRDHGRGDIGNRAWKAVVPLRRKAAPVRINRDERCFAEAWYYPHGTALTTTAWFRGLYDINTFVTAINDFLRGDLNVTWPDGRRGKLTLNKLADACLDKVREEAFGKIDEGYRPEPIRILTIVRAHNETADTDVAGLQRAALNAAISAAGGDPDGKVSSAKNIYSFSRGRVIWRPDRAAATQKNIHTLGCLHRNIELATMQVASLLRGAALLGAVADSNNDSFPPRVEPYARAIAGLIGRINGGRDTYFQECLSDQIAEANARGAIDALRKAVGGMAQLDKKEPAQLRKHD
jgi:hypothetical protein